MSGWLFNHLAGGKFSIGFYAPPTPARPGFGDLHAWISVMEVDTAQEAVDFMHYLNGGNEAQLKLVTAALEKIHAAGADLDELAARLRNLDNTIEQRAVAAVRTADQRGGR